MCFCKLGEDGKLSGMTKRESKTFLATPSALVEVFQEKSEKVLIGKEGPIEILRKTNIGNKNISKEEKKRIGGIDKGDNL